MTNEERNTRITERMDELKLTFCHGHYWSHEYGTPNDYTNVSTEVNSHSIAKDNNGNIIHNVYGSCGCNSYNGAIQCHGFAMYMAYRVFGSYPNIHGLDDANKELNDGWFAYAKESYVDSGNSPYYNIDIEPGDIIITSSHTAILTLGG